MTYLDFATNTEQTTLWSQATGYMPVRTSAVESPEMQAFLDENPNSRVAVEQLPKTQPQDSARVFIPNGDQILGAGWEQILVENRPAAEVWAEVTAELEPEAEAVKEQVAESKANLPRSSIQRGGGVSAAPLASWLASLPEIRGACDGIIVKRVAAGWRFGADQPHAHLNRQATRRWRAPPLTPPRLDYALPTTVPCCPSHRKETAWP